MSTTTRIPKPPVREDLVMRDPDGKTVKIGLHGRRGHWRIYVRDKDNALASDPRFANREWRSREITMAWLKEEGWTVLEGRA